MHLPESLETREVAAVVCTCTAGLDHQVFLHLQLASDGGATVILDCGGADAAISQELLPLLSVLSPNETELARLTGGQYMQRSFWPTYPQATEALQLRSRTVA